MAPGELLIGLACAMGAVVLPLAPTGAGPALRGVAGAVGLAGALAWLVWWPAVGGSEAVCLVAALTAVGAVFGRTPPLAGPLVGGWLTGTWMVTLASTGLPFWIAAPLAIAAPLVALRARARHAAFAPPRVVEDALVVVAVLGLCAAAAPGLGDGWRAAQSLKAIGDAAPESVTLPAWAIGISAMAAGLGAGMGLWSRR